MNGDYPWELAAKCKPPIACTAHGDYGRCLEQDNGDHIPLSDLKKFCACDFPLQLSVSCPVDQHRHSATLEDALRARRDGYTRPVTRLNADALRLLHAERCVCGHARFAHNRLWGKCLHEFGEMEACECQRFASDAMALFSLDEQLNVDVHY